MTGRRNTMKLSKRPSTLACASLSSTLSRENSGFVTLTLTRTFLFSRVLLAVWPSESAKLS